MYYTYNIISSQAGPTVLKSIFIVTLMVLNPAQSERVYEEELGYHCAARGQVSAPLADLWNAPGIEGADWVLMRPDSDAEVYLRFVASPGPGNYEPMKTLGWNAVEIQAEDPDALSHSLDPTRFKIIGPPAFLSGGENIRAMQVLGPDSELLYLTHVIDPSQSTFRIGTAQSWVDRVFIMVLGTSDLAATTRFYQDTLGQPVQGPYPYRVTVLSRAWGKPEDTMYDLSIAQLTGDFLLEIDQYPEEAPLRSKTVTGLPHGPAIVSFLVEDFAVLEQRLGREGEVIDGMPYDQRRVLYVEGPSGEGIELLESR